MDQAPLNLHTNRSGRNLDRASRVGLRAARTS
jgi:hypothetical protein